MQNNFFPNYFKYFQIFFKINVGEKFPNMVKDVGRVSQFDGAYIMFHIDLGENLKQIMSEKLLNL